MFMIQNYPKTFTEVRLISYKLIFEYFLGVVAQQENRFPHTEVDTCIV